MNSGTSVLPKKAAVSSRASGEIVIEISRVADLISLRKAFRGCSDSTCRRNLTLSWLRAFAHALLRSVSSEDMILRVGTLVVVLQPPNSKGSTRGLFGVDQFLITQVHHVGIVAVIINYSIYLVDESSLIDGSWEPLCARTRCSLARWINGFGDINVNVHALIYPKLVAAKKDC